MRRECAPVVVDQSIQVASSTILRHDPVDRLMLPRDSCRFEQFGIQNDVNVACIHAQVRQEIEQALETAEKCPYPDASELLTNVYEK